MHFGGMPVQAGLRECPLVRIIGTIDSVEALLRWKAPGERR